MTKLDGGKVSIKVVKKKKRKEIFATINIFICTMWILFIGILLLERRGKYDMIKKRCCE